MYSINSILRDFTQINNWEIVESSNSVYVNRPIWLKVIKKSDVRYWSVVGDKVRVHYVNGEFTDFNHITKSTEFVNALNKSCEAQLVE